MAVDLEAVYSTVKKNRRRQRSTSSDSPTSSSSESSSPPPSPSTKSTKSAFTYTSYLPTLKVPSMIKLWPSIGHNTSPLDQLTPRAAPNGQERANPFELPAGPSSPTQGTQTPTFYHHHLLNTNPSTPSAAVPRSVADLTPHLFQAQPLTPTSPGGSLALPTTQLSLHAPDFNMRQPPPSKQRQPTADKSTKTSSSSTSSGSSISNAPGPTPTAGPSKGQIHVKLIQARGLNVRSTTARPYAVVQFEQNEFVSRDPIDEMGKEVKGTATTISRNGSSNALSALNAIGAKVGRGKGSNGSSPASSVSSGQSALSLMLGRLPSHSPVWKHEVTL